MSLEQLREYAAPATIAYQQLEIETTKITSILAELVEGPSTNYDLRD